MEGSENQQGLGSAPIRRLGEQQGIDVEWSPVCPKTPAYPSLRCHLQPEAFRDVEVVSLHKESVWLVKSEMFVGVQGQLVQIRKIGDDVPDSSSSRHYPHRSTSNVGVFLDVFLAVTYVNIFCAACDQTTDLRRKIAPATRVFVRAERRRQRRTEPTDGDQSHHHSQ